MDLHKQMNWNVVDLLMDFLRFYEIKNGKTEIAVKVIL